MPEAPQDIHTPKLNTREFLAKIERAKQVFAYDDRFFEFGKLAQELLIEIRDLGSLHHLPAKKLLELVEED